MNERSTAYALLTVLLWATVATAFKLALKHTDPLTMLTIASIASTVVLLPFALLENRLKPRGKPSTYLLHSAGLGLLNPFLYYIVLFKAYDVLPAQLAQPLNYTWPLVLALLSVPFLGQRIGARGLVGILVSFSGVVVLSAGGRISFDAPLYGIGIALGSSLIWAVYWIINSREKADSTRLFYNFLFGSIYIVLLRFALGFEMPDYGGVLWSAYAGVFEMGLAFVLWSRALKYSTNTARTGSLVYLSPFLSLFLIATVLGEQIRWTSILGLALVVAGIITARSGRNQAEVAKPA